MCFSLLSARNYCNGKAPICPRIKVNGIAAESQIRRSVLPRLWDQPTETCKGRDRKSVEINEYIRMLKLKVLTIHRELELGGAHFTARIIMNKLYGAEEKRTLLSILRKHNDDPDCRRTELPLPITSNQEMNDYLKEIGDFCGIDNHLTMHVARYTIATTVTLANDVSLQNITISFLRGIF